MVREGQENAIGNQVRVIQFSPFLLKNLFYRFYGVIIISLKMRNKKQRLFRKEKECMKKNRKEIWGEEAQNRSPLNLGGNLSI